MAKIRTLKAEFFRNAGVSRGGLTTKTLAAGLICAVADDDGRFKAKVDDLKGEIFTHDEVTVEEVDEALQKLATEDFIRLYRDHGRAFGAVVNWKSHQPVPPSRYIASVLPAPPNTKRRRHAPAERKQSQDIASSRAGIGSEGNRKGEEGRGEDTPLKGPPAADSGVLSLVGQISKDPVEEVFEAWRQRWHPSAKLTKDRRAKIGARIREGFAVADLVLAVTEGAAKDPWAERHSGLNDDVKNLLRNGSTVEKFLELAAAPLTSRMPKSSSRASQLDRLYAEAQEQAREENR